MAYSFHPSGRREMTNGAGHPHQHNGGHTGGSHAASRCMQKKQHRHRGQSSSPMGRVILINAPFDGGDESEDIHTVTVDKSPDGRLGFSVRGGSEHGLGIFVSKVDDDSSAALPLSYGSKLPNALILMPAEGANHNMDMAPSAEQAGLCVGDKMMEVNGISLESITMSSAVKVLTGNNRLKMVIRRVGKVPGIRFSKEKTTWVDLIHRRMVVEENGRTPSDASSDSALRRIVHLYTTSDDYCLGFNIRGGKEFGLGIYVSKLDPGGLAELHGIKMGDQILAANGVSFDDITHSNAVEVLKSYTHVMLTIREAGRYPAYKEMVAEYSWLNTLGNGGTASSSQGSESFSSASSLSSGTPVSSLSGLSQVLFPTVFGSDMVDVDICTEDCSPRPSSVERIAETAIRTEPRPPSHHDRISLYSTPSIATETSRTVGATIILKDTVIRGKGEGLREMGGAKEIGRGRSRTLSSGDQEVAKDSPKTAVLLALSTPRKPIRRSQSHITVKEDKQKKSKQQKDKSEAGSKGTLQRSKTFVNLLFKKDRKDKSSRSPSLHGDRDKERRRHFQLLSSPRESRAGVRDGSPQPRPETLEQVENIARKLLSPDEVAAVMRHSRRFLSDNVIEDLVRPLLAILDRPEKLLLLREIRLLIPVSELGRFDSMVMPFELEAYENLKSRSLRSAALRSPSRGTPRRHLITPVPDYRGGFHLRPVQDSERERHLQDDLERERTSGLQAGLLPPSRVFTPLLDVPVDAFPPSAPRSRSPSPSYPPGYYLLAQHGRPVHLSPHRRANGEGDTDGTAAETAAATAPERGRSPVRNGLGRASRREESPDSVDARRRRQDGYTEVSVPVPAQRRQEMAAASARQPPGDKGPAARPEGTQQLNGHSPRNGHRVKRRATLHPEEYDIIAVTISKAKPSLGISISGGMESRVQPMVKIEKIFPGGAASTSEVLKAGYELLSVDSESLQGVTHQHAVDVIRRAFSNKAKDPMVFVVKIPKVTPTSPALASRRD